MKNNDIQEKMFSEFSSSAIFCGLAAHKVIALDAGHVCQNLYLACETIGAGTCAIAAYDQEELLGLDGEEELTVYIASVGKVKK